MNTLIVNYAASTKLYKFNYLKNYYEQFKIINYFVNWRRRILNEIFSEGGYCKRRFTRASYETKLIVRVATLLGSCRPSYIQQVVIYVRFDAHKLSYFVTCNCAGLRCVCVCACTVLISRIGLLSSSSSYSR